MDVLQQSLDNALTKMPALLLERLVSKKLEEQGVEGRALSRKLAAHILSRKAEAFRFKSSKHNGTIKLNFTEADFENITKQADEFCETHLPRLLGKVAGRISKDILKDLKSRWAAEHALQNTDLS